jgi:hypothetical protein
VARIAGLPETVLAHAATFVGQNNIPKEQTPRKIIGASRLPFPAMTTITETPSLPLEKMGIEAPKVSGDAAVGAKLISRLEKLNLNRTTPIQALNILSEIQSMVKDSEQRPLFDEDS